MGLLLSQARSHTGKSTKWAWLKLYKNANNSGHGNCVITLPAFLQGIQTGQSGL